jgi:hypothetical protein
LPFGIPFVTVVVFCFALLWRGKKAQRNVGLIQLLFSRKSFFMPPNFGGKSKFNASFPT